MLLLQVMTSMYLWASIIVASLPNACAIQSQTALPCSKQFLFHSKVPFVTSGLWSTPVHHSRPARAEVLQDAQDLHSDAACLRLVRPPSPTHQLGKRLALSQLLSAATAECGQDKGFSFHDGCTNRQRNIITVDMEILIFCSVWRRSHSSIWQGRR